MKNENDAYISLGRRFFIHFDQLSVIPNFIMDTDFFLKNMRI